MAADLALRRQGEAGRVFRTAHLRRETTMSSKWIANERRMGSWTHVADLPAERRENVKSEDGCLKVKRIAGRLQMGTPGYANVPCRRRKTILQYQEPFCGEATFVASKNYVKKNGPTHNRKPYGPKGGKKVTCDEYNKAVNDKLDKYLEEKGVNSPNDLTDEELQDFADEIKNTTDGDIGAYNQGVADEIAQADAAAAEGAEAAEAAEALEVAAEVDEAVEVTAAVIK